MSRGFSLGVVVATPGALEAMAAAEVDPDELLARHQSGDWGDVPREDVRENNRSLKHGYRVISSYPLEPSVLGARRVWIITEADRSSTTILLPEEC